MTIKNFIADLSQIYFNLKLSLKQFYQNSNFYDKKISKTKDIAFGYKPSPYFAIFNSKISKKKI
jgi:hypothetical protein